MHFSRPSGQRLSWWWPWNRGAVGRLSSGYITVSTFLNISRKVTPNPFTGFRKSRAGTGDLLRHASGVAAVRGVGLQPVVVRQVKLRHRVPRLHGRPGDLDELALLVVVPVSLGLFGLDRLDRPDPLQVPLVAVVPEHDQQDEQHQDDAGDGEDDRRVP